MKTETPKEILELNDILKANGYKVKFTKWNRDSKIKVCSELLEDSELEPNLDLSSLPFIKHRESKRVFPVYSLGIFPSAEIDIRPLRQSSVEGGCIFKVDGWKAPIHGFVRDKKGIMDRLDGFSCGIKALLHEGKFSLDYFKEFAWDPHEIGDNVLYLANFSLSNVRGNRYVIFPGLEYVGDRFDVKDLSLDNNWDGAPKGIHPDFYNYENREDRIK